jgi:hypothetical protein
MILPSTNPFSPRKPVCRGHWGKMQKTPERRVTWSGVSVFYPAYEPVSLT